MSRTLSVRRLGLVPYDEALAIQDRLVEERRRGDVGDTLLLLRHPPVITLGVRVRHDWSHVLASPEELEARGIAVRQSGRGGAVTYHGPGQLIGYPVLDLAPDRCDLHRYVRDLEETLIRALMELEVEGSRIAGLTGVWVGNAKVAAIGVRVSRWITSHGFALNVADDLGGFDLIVPCGITDRRVTSVERRLDRPVPMNLVEEAVARAMAEVFA